MSLGTNDSVYPLGMYFKTLNSETTLFVKSLLIISITLTHCVSPVGSVKILKKLVLHLVQVLMMDHKIVFKKRGKFYLYL